MGCESFDVVRFDLGSLLQGQMIIAKLKSLITSLLLVLEVCNVKAIYRKSWAGNLLMWSDLTFVTVTGKHGSNYRLSLSCNRKSKKLNLTNLFNSQQ